MDERARVGAIVWVFGALVGCAAKPIAQVDAPVELVRRTRAFAMGGLWHGLTRYCVAQDGSVTDVSTKLVSGDPELDALHREAVARWRYKPTRTDQGRCHVVETREDFGDDKREGQAMSAEAAALRAAAEANEPPSFQSVASILIGKGLRGWLFFNRTEFCVEVDGSLGPVRTLRRTGLLELDALARDTVAAWKFEPRAARACSDVLFVFGAD